MSTLLCERNRVDYVSATGAFVQVPIDRAVDCVLELPESYALSLLHALERALEQSPLPRTGKLRLDVPFSLHLDRDQVEQLVQALRKVVSA